MDRASYFEAGLIVIAVIVLAAISAGCLAWILWFLGRSKWNLCGDRSSELITSLPQPIPRWTVFDFVLMFGMMLVVSWLMLQLNPKTDMPKADRSTAASVAEDAASTDSTDTVTAPSVELESPPAATDKAEGDSKPAPSSEDLRRQIRNHFIANLAALIFTLVFLNAAYGATLQHLSLIPSTSDLRRGLVATVWILSPVLLLNMAIGALVEYKHPVTDFLAEESGTQTFAALFLSTAILTPIAEEFQFRLLLQGGLQRFADPPTVENNWRPSTAWPIFVTSLIFAIMHLGHGAAPIPLFFLSVGLGFLYQRTGRLWIAISVHMLLNGATLCMEFCKVNAGP